MSLRQRIADWVDPTSRAVREQLAVEKYERAREPIGVAGPDMFHGIGHDARKSMLLRNIKGAPSIAMRPIAERLEQLELQVVAERRVADGTTEEEILDDHPLALLFRNPGLSHSMSQMLYLMGWVLPSVGDVYLLKIQRRMMGFEIPIALQFLPTQNVSPIVQQGVVVGYSIVANSGQTDTLDPSEVVRIWKPDPEHLYNGRGTLGNQTVLSDRLNFTEEHLRKHFESDAIPPIMLENSSAEGAERPDPDSPSYKRWLSAWRSAYHRRRGVRGVVPAYLPTGWKPHIIDAHGGEQRVGDMDDQGLQKLLMAFGVPRSILGHVVSGDRSSAETNQFVFDMHSVMPYTTTIADALTSQLAQDYPQEPNTRLLVRFAEFVSRDKVFELQREEADLRGKVRSPQQILRDRGADPEDASWGELPVGTLAEEPYTGEVREFDAGGGGLFGQVPVEEDEETERAIRPGQVVKLLGGHRRMAEMEWSRQWERDKRWSPRFERDYRAVLNQQQAAVKSELRGIVRSAAGGFTRGIRDNILEALERALSNLRWQPLYERTTERTRRGAYVDTGQDSMALLPTEADFIFTDVARRELARVGTEFQAQVNSTTLQANADAIFRELDEGMGKGESMQQLARRVNAAVNHAFSTRRHVAEGVARTEVLTATQGAQIESFRQAGVPAKRWNTSLVGVRDSHQIDGTVVPLDRPFSLRSGVSAMIPGDTSLPAGDRINCRCFLTPVFADEIA